MGDPSGNVCSARDQQLRQSGVPAAGLRSLPLITHLSSKKRNSVPLKRWRASALGAAMPTVPCPSPEEPRVAVLERRWRLPECRRCAPGVSALSPGAAGLSGTCRQMSVSPLCQQPGGSLPAPEMLQGGPCTFSEAVLSLVAVR